MKKKKKAEEASQADQSGGQGQQPEEKKRTVPENLLYWMRTLYRESPGFVWLYLAGCGVAVGISLLGVYMPSVLVADITEGGSVRSILGDLAVLGGGLVCLYLLSNWLERTKGILGSRIGQRQALQATDLALETNYDNIERADFPEEIWQLVERHMWTRDYNTGFLEAFAAVLTAVVGMILYTGMLSGLSLWILLLVIAGTALNYVVGYGAIGGMPGIAISGSLWITKWSICPGVPVPMRLPRMSTCIGCLPGFGRCSTGS